MSRGLKFACAGLIFTISGDENSKVPELNAEKSPYKVNYVYR